MERKSFTDQSKLKELIEDINHLIGVYNSLCGNITDLENSEKKASLTDRWQQHAAEVNTSAEVGIADVAGSPSTRETDTEMKTPEIPTAVSTTTDKSRVRLEMTVDAKALPPKTAAGADHTTPANALSPPSTGAAAA
jgi:hypothetical protein